MSGARQALIQRGSAESSGFVWRSHDISRIEGLSDAVFAFAVTLLIVSLEVPHTFQELYEIMGGFVPFAISAAMLFQIWHAQFTWFRRYGLQDNITLALNALLLFFVLFYVYPLKFLFTYLVNAFTGGGGMARLPDGRTVPMLSGGDAYTMMMVYSGGFIAVFGVFILLYLHAWRKREVLELTPAERHDTLEKLGGYLCLVAVGLCSIGALMWRGPSWSGIVFFAIAPVLTVYHTVMGSRRRRLFERR